jgi:hypothetical protein
VSPIDHIERRFAARRLDGTPLYVATGFATSVMRSEWLWGMAAHLVYGVPVTLFLFFSLFAVLCARSGFTPRSIAARLPRKRCANRRNSTPSAT